VAINVVSDTTVSANQILDELIPRLDDIVSRRASVMESFMEGTWHSDFPQASGRPSQSTGASAEAITIDGFANRNEVVLEFTIGDNVNPDTGQPASEYAEYVHNTGAPVGQALDRARDQFQQGVTDIIEDIETAAAAILARR